MNWRRYLLIGAGCGISVVLMIAAIALLYSWDASRPKQWDKTSIVLSGPVYFSQSDWLVVYPPEPRNTVDIVFDLQNNTGTDYTLQKSVSVMGRIASTNALVDASDGLSTSQDYFIPAHDKVRVTFEATAACPNDTTDWRTCIAENIKNAEALVLFDSANHIEITIRLQDNTRFNSLPKN